jgi:hypothetical protein
MPSDEEDPAPEHGHHRPHGSSSGEEGEEGIWGVRRQLRRTNWLYRGDALTTGDIRNMRDYFLSSQALLLLGSYLVAHIVRLIVVIHTQTAQGIRAVKESVLVSVLIDIFKWSYCLGYRYLLHVEDFF